MIGKDEVILDVERVLGVTFGAAREVADATALHAVTEERRQADLLRQLETHCLAWHGQGRSVFMGLEERDRSHGIFAMEPIDPLALMAAFRVGSHSAEDNIAARAVAGMRRIMIAAPFVPYFADAAGLKVKFEQPVPPALAEELEAQVLELDLDALDLVEEQDGLPSLAHAISRTQRLELWWD